MKNVLGLIRTTTSKNLPTVFTVMACIGVVGTAVMSAKAMSKAQQIIDEATAIKNQDVERLEEVEPLSFKEVVKETWPVFVPTVIGGAVTIACVITANSVNLKRNAALASLYSATGAALKEYQEKVVEILGEKKAEEVKTAVYRDRIKENPPQDSEVILTGKGETLCYDSFSGRYFKGDIEKIKAAINQINKDMLNDTFIPLNEAYYYLGLNPTKMGEITGWHIDDGFIAVSFYAHLCEDGTPCLAVDYNVEPRYRYVD